MDHWYAHQELHETKGKYGRGVYVLEEDGTVTAVLIARNFIARANPDGTLDTDFLDGDKEPEVTLSFNAAGLLALVDSNEVGTPLSVNVRQFVGGNDPDVVASAPITIVQESGDNPVTEGWAISGDFLTHPGNQTGSGVFHLHVEDVASGAEADSSSLPWSWVALTNDDWNYSATVNGLHNGGTPGGNWVTWSDTPLNSNPSADGYLRLTASSAFSGISSHHATPTFTQGVTYAVEIEIHAGSTNKAFVVAINSGDPVAINTPVAGVHNVNIVAGGGSNAFLVYYNGNGVAGDQVRVVDIALNDVQDVFVFAQSAYSGVETDPTIPIAMTRVRPSGSAATVNVAITTGGTLATNNTPVLSWAAGEGGNKTGTITPSNSGTVVLTASSPSVGTIGSPSTTTVTINDTVDGVTFPILGSSFLHGHYFGASAYENITDQMADFDVVVMGGWPELQGQRNGVSNQDIAAAVKAASTRPRGTTILFYIDPEGVYKDAAGIFATQRQKFDTMNWRLRTAYPSGAFVDSYYGDQKYAANRSGYSPLDSDGLSINEWLADHSADWVHEGADGNEVATDIDGLIHDNFDLFQRTTGDWNRDGTTNSTDSNAAAALSCRQETAAFVHRYLDQYPNKKIIGNWGQFLQGEVTNIQAQFPEMWRIMHGGLLEHALANGAAYNPPRLYMAEHFYSTAAFVAKVQNCEDAMLQPELGMLSGYASDGSATNFQEMRHGLCCTLNICNLAFSWGADEIFSVVPHFDEYDFNLGARIGTRQTGPTQNGIWRADFEHGIALWCPKNVTGTITLGGTFFALTGNAAAFLTPGQAVISVTFTSPRNGIILRR